jgi:hypothetical protein
MPKTRCFRERGGLPHVCDTTEEAPERSRRGAASEVIAQVVFGKGAPARRPCAVSVFGWVGSSGVAWSQCLWL